MIFENKRPRKKFGPKLETAIREPEIIGRGGGEKERSKSQWILWKNMLFCKMSAKQSAG